MKKEIIDFYADKGLHISKMINRRPYDVSPEQIEAAAELVYYDIQNGHELKNIQIASEVFRVAKDINGEKYAQEKALLEEAKKIISNLKIKLNESKANVKEALSIMENKNRIMENKNRRLKIYLIIALTLWPYIMIFLRGL